MKNIDVINSIIANKTGIDEKTIKAVNKYFWKVGVKKNLSTLESNAVFIRGLGTIVVSRYNLRKIILKTIRKIRAVRISTKFKEQTKVIYLEELYNRLTKLLKSRNEIAILYKERYERNKRISEDDSVSTEE